MSFDVCVHLSFFMLTSSTLFLPKRGRRLRGGHGGGDVPLSPRHRGAPRQVSAWTAAARGVPAVAAAAGDRLDAIDGAAAAARGVLAARYPPSPVVLCHNDLLAGNVLLREAGAAGARGGGAADTSAAAAAVTAAAVAAGGGAPARPAAAADMEVFLIDFEYAGWGPRGFDIGNHWDERRGGTDDGVSQRWRYPDAAARRAFCRSYLQTAAGGAPVADAVVDTLVGEATRWAGVAHLHWAEWAYAQAGSSTVAFDYVGYGRRRLDTYEADAAERGLV